MSTGTGRKAVPSSAAVLSRSVVSRSTARTDQPSTRKRSATARPMPLAAPVTKAADCTGSVGKEAAVDDHLRSRDEAGVVGRWEGDRSGDLPDVGAAAHRSLRDHTAFLLVLVHGVLTPPGQMASSCTSRRVRRAPRSPLPRAPPGARDGHRCRPRRLAPADGRHRAPAGGLRDVLGRCGALAPAGVRAALPVQGFHRATRAQRMKRSRGQGVVGVGCKAGAGRSDHGPPCHRRRVSDRVVFHKMLQLLHFGCSYEAIADPLRASRDGVGATARARRAAGAVAEALLRRGAAVTRCAGPGRWSAEPRPAPVSPRPVWRSPPRPAPAAPSTRGATRPASGAGG